MMPVRKFLFENEQADAGDFKLVPRGSGWLLQRKLRAFALAATLAASGMVGSMPARAADNANAQVMVGATVLRHLGIRVLTLPRTIQILAADIVRGYVDMPLASTLEIRSNSPGGYLLAIDSPTDFSRATEVRSMGGVASLDGTGSVLSFQASGGGMQTTPVVLSFRVLLSGDARPGIYPWPIHISVLPA